MTIEYTQISEKAIAAMKKNYRAIGRLMAAFDRGADTIGNWMRDKDVRLTTPLAVQIISEETGLSEEEVLEAKVQPQAA